MCFVVVSVLVAKEAATGATTKELLKNILKNSFVIAVILGLCFNWTGFYHMLLTSSLGGMFEAALSQATMPIVSMVLFILGYDLKVDKKTLAPILKLVLIKTIYYTFVIAGFFLLFPEQMADKTFMIAPMIYFMCPTGFGLLPIITPLYKDESEISFTSAFVSVYMIITLIVYTVIVIWIA